MGKIKDGEGAATTVVMAKTCKRCKETYDPSTNTSSSCRFHPSFFVCRRHDDQKRYYQLGPNDPPYAAKFYDCCGAEDPDASGCTTDYHISYDDRENLDTTIHTWESIVVEVLFIRKCMGRAKYGC